MSDHRTYLRLSAHSFITHALIPSFYLPMKSNHSFLQLATISLSLAAGPSLSLGCSVCGCSLSSDWAAQGYSSTPGLETNVRFEYYNQSELRSGTHNVNRAGLDLPNDDEIQQSTVNRNTVLGLDYGLNHEWSISSEIPYYDRFHSTIAAGDTEISTSHANGLGDLRVLGRWQNFSPRESYGLQFGLKLPTGRFDQNFSTGLEAGTPLDRGLQLGTGTTDLLLGASYFVRIGNTFGYFAQAILDQPLDERDGFRPSSSVNLNGGLRLLTTSGLTPQLQLNGRWDGRESGLNADRDNSGDTMLYLSPGVTTELNDHLHIFVFFQVPLYQRVNGLQLEPRWLLSLGVQCRL